MRLGLQRCRGGRVVRFCAAGREPSSRSRRRKEAEGNTTQKSASLRRRLRLGRARHDARFGFTLLELMVVVVLMGIMTAMIIPEMKGTYGDAVLRSTGRKLVSVLNLASSRAITLNQLHRVRLETRRGRFVLERPVREGEGRSGFVPVRDISGTEGELDSRISVEVRRPGEESSDAPEAAEPKPLGGAPETERREDVIAFHPDGTADAREILLRDRAGFRLAIRINPTTGRVSVVELERE